MAICCCIEFEREYLYQHKLPGSRHSCGITALELPVCDWDEKWIDVYLDNSVKLLDICIAFSSELSRLNQGHLILQCVLHNLDCHTPKQFVRARASLDGWRQHINSKNPRLENCSSILDNLTETLNHPKVKTSAKGKVLQCMELRW